MKKLITSTLFIFTVVFSYGQQKFDTLIDEGIVYHDNGDYDNAIEKYLEALEINPKSALANYEIALSYFTKGDNESAVKYASIVIKQKSDYSTQAYVIKGSALDMMGKTKESIKLFEKAIKKYDENYLLYFNLALNYYKIYELDKAEENAIKAIEVNQYHASSHYMLAQIHNQQGNTVKALLSAHYFLFLEPNSNRSVSAYDILKYNFGGNVKQDSAKANTINININALSDEFGTTEMMIGLMVANNYSEDNKDKTQEELFIENTKSVFDMLGEQLDEKNTEIWWGLYTSFFYDIAQSEHLEAYCYYISQSGNENAKIWVEENPSKLEEFSIWLDQNQY